MQQDFLQEEASLSSIQKSHKPWLFGAIGFFLGAIIFFLAGQNYTLKPVLIQDPFAGARYGIAGKVVLVEDNILTIGVDSTAFGLPVTAYKVYTDGKTVFKKTVYAKNSKGGLNVFELKPISTVSATLADVMLEFDVAAKSKSNFGNLKEFTASEVEIRIYQ